MQPMGRFYAANGSAVCSISTIVRRPECNDPVFDRKRAGSGYKVRDADRLFDRNHEGFAHIVTRNDNVDS
jgi:hypothetical protein